MANLAHSAVAACAVFPQKGGSHAATEQAGGTSARPTFRLLVVDDDPAIREITSAMLAEQGYEVLTAEDGLQALEFLPQFRPDLVITDLRMPRMSGFELLEIMRERFPGLPVIAVSGEVLGDDLPPSLIADAFLPKGGCYIRPLGAKIVELLSTGTISSNPRISRQATP
jgi:CheY-like chemotaxis protein